MEIILLSLAASRRRRPRGSDRWLNLGPVGRRCHPYRYECPGAPNFRGSGGHSRQGVSPDRAGMEQSTWRETRPGLLAATTAAPGRALAAMSSKWPAASAEAWASAAPAWVRWTLASGP